MRIERLNENQIRCTLDKTDLEQRQLRLSELAKGSTKAREALHEMIQQASLELDFEVENIPLMVEAIPLSSECLVLVITRIADPEKLEDKLTLLSKLAGMVKNELKDTTLTDINEDDILEDAYDDYDDGEDIITFGGKDQMTDDDWSSAISLMEKTAEKYKSIGDSEYDMAYSVMMNIMDYIGTVRCTKNVIITQKKVLLHTNIT